MTVHTPIIEDRVPVLFTVRQAAKILNLSKTKIHLLIKDGSLESVLIGRSRRITEGQLLKFIWSLEETALLVT
jgi:excisionase family DNA binding protein